MEGDKVRCRCNAYDGFFAVLTEPNAVSPLFFSSSDITSVERITLLERAAAVLHAVLAIAVLSVRQSHTVIVSE